MNIDLDRPDVAVRYFTRRGAEHGRDIVFTLPQHVPSLVRVRRDGGLLRRWVLEVWL
jgi:hypothetical protein